MNMENVTKLLSGSEIIFQKLYGPKELPTSGWKEYCPSNSWLEQKQIQACLEDKCATIGAERIEKQSNLAQAEWITDCKKAKVLKKVGKQWEVVGHHQNNEDWLLPEEALYLIEINVLELYHSGVPVSVEQAYSLLLGEAHNCTFQEYRVYSYLSRRGYKLIRHDEDVTVTRYEKQINLEQVLESQKRNHPTTSTGQNTLTEKEITVSINEIPQTIQDGIEMTNKIISSSRKEEIPKSNKDECSTKHIDSEDICIIEDNIEIIEIEDSTLKKTLLPKSDVDSCTIFKTVCNVLTKDSNIAKNIKTKTAECVIFIDDEDDMEEEEDDDLDVKQESESDSSEEMSSDDDIILVKSVRIESRQWYKPLRKCLIPVEVVVVDLSDENSTEIKLEKDVDDCLKLVENKTRNAILGEMTNAKSGVSFIRAPNAIFLPKEIVPRHSQYRVNLNMRQEPNFQQNNTTFYSLNRRQQQFFNSNFPNNQTSNSFLGENLFKQAYEMRAMAMSMIEAASSLMSAVNTPAPLMSDIQVPPFYNQNQYANLNYTPRLFNNNMINSNNNFFNSNMFNLNPRNPYIARNSNYSYGRRNFRFRGYRNNNNRSFVPHQRQMSRYHRNNSSSQEIVMIDSDDDSHTYTRTKRKNNHAEHPSKKNKSVKSIEIIDLCEEKTVKSEPNELNSKILERKEQKKNIQQSHLSENREDFEQKPNIEKENKQNILDKCGGKIFLVESLDETKKEVGNNCLENVDSSDIKTEKLVEFEKKLTAETPTFENTFNTEEICKQAEVTDKTVSASPISHTEVTSNDSPSMVEEMNDNEVSNVIESSTPEDEGMLDEDDVPVTEEPTSWQQYKEQSEQIVISSETNISLDIPPLTQIDQVKDIASLLKNLQIFDTIDELLPNSEERKKLKISFDAYLPNDHFKKTVKVLPKFRLIIVNSTDSLPSKLETDYMKSSYQDGIPFLYAIVYDDTIAFYYYDSITLTEFYHEDNIV